MPHRAKNKHRPRHRTHTTKAASLSIPALPLSASPGSEPLVLEVSPDQSPAAASPKALTTE